MIDDLRALVVKLRAFDANHHYPLATKAADALERLAARVSELHTLSEENATSFLAERDQLRRELAEAREVQNSVQDWINTTDQGKAAAQVQRILDAARAKEEK